MQLAGFGCLRLRIAYVGYPTLVGSLALYDIALVDLVEVAWVTMSQVERATRQHCYTPLVIVSSEIALSSFAASTPDGNWLIGIVRLIELSLSDLPISAYGSFGWCKIRHGVVEMK